MFRSSKWRSIMRSPTNFERQEDVIIRNPHPKVPGTLAGITEPMIGRSFTHSTPAYASIRCWDRYSTALALIWDAHLDELCAFWSSVTLMTGRYKGTPMQAHAALTEITLAHFERWLALFQFTASKTCPPDAAALFVDRANRIPTIGYRRASW